MRTRETWACTAMPGIRLPRSTARPWVIVWVASRRPMAQVERVEADPEDRRDACRRRSRTAARERGTGTLRSQQPAAMASLEAREQQYRAIFDGSADCLGLWNQHEQLVDVNQAFTRIRGLDARGR